MAEQEKTREKSGEIVGQSKMPAGDSQSQSICPVGPDSPCRLENIALDTAINAISFADISGRVTYANRAFLDLLGFKDKEEVLGRHTYEFWASKDDSVKMRRELFEKERWIGEMMAKKKDGSLFYARLSAHLVKDESGRPRCTMACFIDITETKRTIEALRQSEKNFKMLFYDAAEGIITADVKTKRFKYVNPAACRLLGYTEDELTKLSVMDIHPKESLAKVLDTFETQVRGERPLAENTPCLRKDGTIIYANINAARALIDGKEYNVGFFTDVTDRLRAEEEVRRARDELEMRVQQRTADLARVNEELRREIAERARAEKARAEVEKRFQDIFENAMVGIYRTTPDGQILMANPAIVKMLGYPSFEALKKINLEKTGFKSSYPRSGFKQMVERNGSVAGLESVWGRPDGNKIVVRESAIAVRDETGKVLYYEGTVEDITERKKAEEKLLAYQKQLRSLALELSLSEERMRRQMAMSLHDHLGQNLAISKIKLDGLRKSIKTGEHLEELNEIRNLLGETIESVRSLTFELSPPVLYELGFEAAVEWLVRFVCKRDGLVSKFSDDGKPKPLEEDVRILLFQSVREILVNISKHAHAKKISVAISRANTEIQVSIADDGVGFDVDAIKSSDTRTKGFGLFSVSERLASISGRFEIDSKPGAGTKVLLAAPVSRKKVRKKGKGK
jgi:PAS domain S-box-containing protein